MKTRPSAAETEAYMILTVTLNPAVDKTYRTEELFAEE